VAYAVYSYKAEHVVCMLKGLFWLSMNLKQGCSHFFSMRASYYVTKSRRSTGRGGQRQRHVNATRRDRNDMLLLYCGAIEKVTGGGPIFDVMRSTIGLLRCDRLAGRRDRPVDRDRRIEHPWSKGCIPGSFMLNIGFAKWICIINHVNNLHFD